MEKLYCILDIEDKKTMTYLTEDMLNIADKLYPDGGYIKIKISDELHNYLVGLGQCKLIADVEDRAYTIEDKNLFEEIKIEIVDDGIPTIPDTIKSLGEELTQEKLKNIQKDSTIAQLGQELAKVKLEVINMKGGN